jgi:hypothetical protein
MPVKALREFLRRRGEHCAPPGGELYLEFQMGLGRGAAARNPSSAGRDAVMNEDKANAASE